MAWIQRILSKESTSSAADELDAVIRIIERFAPRQYARERRVFYYNYRTQSFYGRPLLELIRCVRSKSRMKQDPDAHVAEIFEKLKDFYDPGARLSHEEAQADPALRKKFRDLMRFFYGMENVRIPEVGEQGG
jgi:hypothetical protein